MKSGSPSPAADTPDELNEIWKNQDNIRAYEASMLIVALKGGIEAGQMTASLAASANRVAPEMFPDGLVEACQANAQVLNSSIQLIKKVVLSNRDELLGCAARDKKFAASLWEALTEVGDSTRDLRSTADGRSFMSLLNELATDRPIVQHSR